MLAMRLFAFMLSILLCNASPILRRQVPSQSLSQSEPAASLTASPSFPALAVPSESLSSPSQSDSALLVSQSDSAEPSASLASESLVSESLSAPVSASATPTFIPSPASVPPTLSPKVSTPEPSPPIVTPEPEPSLVVNKLPPSSVTHFVTASPSDPAGSAQLTGGTSKSFWENRGAVIATFVIVGLVALGLLCVVFFFLRKRAIRKEQESLDEGFFEKFNDTHSDRSDSRVGHTGPSSPLPSSTDLHSQQPMAVRDYGTTGNALAPHLAFSGQSYAPYQYQDSQNYVRTDERSLDRPGSGDSFYGGPTTTTMAQRVPRGY